jgi:hypothetical protein
MEETFDRFSLGVTFRGGVPFVEARACFEGGKISILRTPILPPGATDAQIEALTEREIVDPA